MTLDAVLATAPVCNDPGVAADGMLAEKLGEELKGSSAERRQSIRDVNFLGRSLPEAMPASANEPSLGGLEDFDPL